MRLLSSASLAARWPGSTIDTSYFWEEGPRSSGSDDEVEKLGKGGLMAASWSAILPRIYISRVPASIPRA
jgi:hypothetical protein